MYRLYGDRLNVYPQELTAQGTRVERALAQYKREVSPPFYTTGHVDECPSLKLSPSEPEQDEVLFQHPYSNVEELYPMATQSQVGTANKTVFRLDARKSKEFSSVEVLNEPWKEKVKAVCDQIRQVLVPGVKEVTAELYKLLVYGEGDFFRSHQDAQHSARMFATLLFILPIQHTGGGLCMYRPGGDYRDVTTIEDKKMPNGCSWAAFYTDVHHDVNKVDKGFRIVLNYSLSFEGAMCPSSFLPKMGPSAEGIIKSYFTTSADNKKLAIPLTYEYTRATLSPDFLKGIDAYVFNALDGIALLELRFVLLFDKTKVIPQYDECDHEQVFQGVFLVEQEHTKKYFEIQSKFEQKELEVPKDDANYQTIYRSLREECDREYLALKEEVKSSQENILLEWIVERVSGQPKEGSFFGRSHLSFEHGSLGWLGNMTPAEEYYYLRAAMVVQGKK
jgi:hypothetical protein